MVLYCNGIETIIFTLWKFGFPRRNVWESTAMVTWLSFCTLLSNMSATRSAAICPVTRIYNKLGEIHK